MRKRRFLLLLVVLAAFTTPWAAADGNLNFVLSTRHLEDDSWDQVQNQVGFGVSVDFSPENWPIHWTFGIAGSMRNEDSDGELDWFETPDYSGRIAEATFGVTFLPVRRGITHPYIGVGIAKTYQSLELNIGDDVEESDNSFGYYVNAGVYWDVGERFHIGIDGRILRGTDGTLFGVERSADYKQLGLLLGFRF